MPLIHNQTSLPLEAGKSLFDYADDLAVRVPTSCGRTGECHECIVEVRNGRPKTDNPPHEAHRVRNGTPLNLSPCTSYSIGMTVMV